MADLREFTDANFEAEVLNSDKPVLVDFWATWCGPCRAMEPAVKEISSEYSDKAVVGKLNVDENQGVAAKYGIRSIPALLYFKNGEVVGTTVGLTKKAAIAQKLDTVLA